MSSSRNFQLFISATAATLIYARPAAAGNRLPTLAPQTFNSLILMKQKSTFAKQIHKSKHSFDLSTPVVAAAN